MERTCASLQGGGLRSDHEALVTSGSLACVASPASICPLSPTACSPWEPADQPLDYPGPTLSMQLPRNAASPSQSSPKGFATTAVISSVTLWENNGNLVPII